MSAHCTQRFRILVVDAVRTKTTEPARSCADDLDEAAGDLKLRDVADLPVQM